MNKFIRIVIVIIAIIVPQHVPLTGIKKTRDIQYFTHKPL